MAKDHGGDIHLLLLVHLNRNTAAIVPHTDQVVLPIESIRTCYTQTLSLACWVGCLWYESWHIHSMSIHATSLFIGKLPETTSCLICYGSLGSNVPVRASHLLCSNICECMTFTLLTRFSRNACTDVSEGAPLHTLLHPLSYQEHNCINGTMVASAHYTMHHICNYSPINHNLQRIHLWVSLLVVCSINYK